MKETKAVIYHYGIPGMRWGVRRFQNEDGSSTPKGKKRFNTGDVIKNKQPKKQLSPKEQAVRKAKIKKGLTIAGNILGVVGTLVAADYVMAKLDGQPNLIDIVGSMVAASKLNK